MKFRLDKVPKLIKPCPIIEAVCELRFEASVPHEAIIGVLYRDLAARYPKSNKLPVLELPSTIRDKDPDLAFSPYFQLSNESYRVSIGPRVFSVFSLGEYKGWDSYSKEIEFAFNLFVSAKVMKTPNRLGYRVVNFFEDRNILGDLRIDFSLCGQSSLDAQQTFFRAEFKDEFLRIVTLNSNVTVVESGKRGSVVDLDVIHDFEADKKLDVKKLTSQLHQEEKVMFFSMLKPEMLKTLSPEY